MDRRVPRSQYPWWVRLSLWGVPGRRGLQFFIALSMATGLAAVLYGLSHPLYLFGGVTGLGAVPYWLAMRWMDEHGGWEEEEKRGP